MKLTLIKFSLVIGAMLLLSACFGPVKTEPKTTYLIDSIPRHVPTRHKQNINLLVSIPDTRPVLNTTGMAYTVRPYEIAFFSQNQWGETPSQMLQPLLVATLEETKLFRTVASAPYSGPYDYILSTEIIDMEENFTCKPNSYVVSIRAQLLRGTTNEVIATKQFMVTQRIQVDTPYAGVIAANQATRRILQEIAIFTLQHLSR